MVILRQCPHFHLRGRQRGYPAGPRSCDTRWTARALVHHLAHFYHNVFSHLPSTRVRGVKHMLKAISRPEAPGRWKADGKRAAGAGDRDHLFDLSRPLVPADRDQYGAGYEGADLEHACDFSAPTVWVLHKAKARHDVGDWIPQNI